MMNNFGYCFKIKFSSILKEYFLSQQGMISLYFTNNFVFIDGHPKNNFY